MFDKIKSKAFWQSAIERTVGTFWQSFSGGFVVGAAVPDASALKTALLAAAVASALAFLKCVTVGLATDGNPSMGSSEILAADGATAQPLGEEEQKTVVPDPTGEIAEQVQADAAAEEEAALDADVAPEPVGPSDDALLS